MNERKHPSPISAVRIDKWLWAARFYKTRSLASDEVQSGRVLINGQRIKPARDVRLGDHIALQQAGMARMVVVLAISAVRGPAQVAQQLYEETPESVAQRALIAANRHLQVEPAHSRESGRPTKHDRRALDAQARSAMDDRWRSSWSQDPPP